MAGESRVVTLVKGTDGLGIAVTTVVAGEMRWPRVSSVRPGSVAEKCGAVVVGDLIAEVNGFCVAGKTHLFVRELLQLAPNSSPVTLKLLQPAVGLLEGEESHSSITGYYPPRDARVRPFSKTPSCDSPAPHTDLPDQCTTGVRRSQSECYRKLRPLPSYPLSLQHVLRSSSIHCQGAWEGRPLQRGSLVRQSTEGLSSSGLGDSLSSLSSLPRHDPTAAERWPECGEYTAVGTDLHRAVVRRDLNEVERLLTFGSSVYSLDSNGDTPLDLASRAGYLEVLALMEELYEGSVSSQPSKTVRQSPSVEEMRPGGRLRGQRRRHTKADVRKELAKAYENIGSKV